MARTGYELPQDGDPGAKLSSQDARQGQNIKGMVWVLIVGVALVVAAFAVMLTLQAQPVTSGNELAPAAMSDPTPAVMETAKSPQ